MDGAAQTGDGAFGAVEPVLTASVARRLRESDERLQLLMRGADDGLWDWNLATDEVYFSPRWKQVLGYEDHEIRNRLEEWESRVHPDDRERALAAIRAHVAGETPLYECEHRLLHKDGAYRWIRARGVAQRDADGTARRMAGSHLDVTERRRAEEELRRSRQAREDLINTVEGIVWEADALSIQFTFVSEQAERLLGYPARRWTEEPTFWRDHLHPDDREWVTEYCGAETAERRDHQLEYRMIAADGRTVWLRDIVTFGVDQSGVPKLRGIMVDITERRRTEEELHRRDAILEAVRLAAERFLSGGGWRQHLPPVLEQLGRATGVSRAYMALTAAGRSDGGAASYEWLAPDVAPHSDGPLLRSPAFRRWADLLRRGEIVFGHTRQLPAEELHGLAAQGIQSFALVPICVADAWWGSIGFEDCVGERDWSSAELDALKAAASVIAAAIERGRAEQALLTNETQLRAIFEQSGLGIALYGRSERPIRSNRALERMLGYSQEEFRELDMTEYTHPDDVARHLALQHEMDEGERERYQMEKRYIRKDGEPVWGRLTVSKDRDDEGNTAFVVALIEDIGERKEAERRLLESEQRYRSLFDHHPDAVYALDADGRCTSANAACERVSGYPMEELLGMQVAALMAEEERERAVASFRIALTGEPQQYETVIVRRDGRRAEIHVTNLPMVVHGRVAGVYGVAQDVTEHNRAERALRQQEEQYRGIFEATNDGLTINDLDGNLVEANPAMWRMHGYEREEFLTLHPSDFIHPDDHGEFQRFVSTVGGGREFRTRATDVRKDGSTFPVEVHGVGFMYAGTPHILGVVRDTTEEVRAYELLEQRVTERTRELSTLLDVSHTVTSTLEVPRLLGLILDGLRSVVDYTGAALYLHEDGEFRVIEYRVPPAAREALRGRPPVADAYREVFRSRRPLIIPDMRADTPLARAFQVQVGDGLTTTFGHMRAWLGVPLMLQDRVIGGLGLSHDAPGFFTPHHAELVLAVANQAAIAIENARLYAAAQEAAHRTAAMAHIASSVALGGPLGEMVDGVCEQVVRATGTLAAAVALREHEPQRVRVVGTYGHPEGYEGAFNAVIRSKADTAALRAFEERRTIVKRDGRRDTLARPELEPLHPYMREAEWDTFVAVPMTYREEAVGVLIAYYPPDKEPGEAEVAFLATIADQAAVAAENIRLYAEAQGKAALEERQKLARELHDSVSQALYGIALGAKTARTLLDRDAERAAQPMEYVLSLAEAGLAEMRALIFELRPESLEAEGLVAAIEKQAASLKARHGIEVRASLCEEPALHLEHKEALYRIAQEALHNTVKHARAGVVEVRMECSVSELELSVSDDGAGFDPTAEYPGHLGLRGMRERVARLGGGIAIESAPGRGTRLRVRIPLGERS